MSDIAPAGWHPDPRGRHEHRYWDGTTWTDHVADAGQMSIDPVDEVSTPIAPSGPSRVDLPAVEPAAVAAPAEPEPDPEPARHRAEAGDGPWSAGGADDERATVTPGPDPAGPEPARERKPAEPQPMLDAIAGARSPDLAALLSIVFPGSGHFYLGVDARKRTTALGLLGATVVAIVLSYFSLFLFIVGLVIWAGAAVYALLDLRGGLAGVRGRAWMCGWSA